MSSLKKRSVLHVNLAVLLFGLAGLFAKWIRLPALTITFGRVLFSSLTLGLFIIVRKQSFQIRQRKDALLLICAGSILAVHWWSFLTSVQISTVAIGTITFSAFPLFVTFLEPLIFRQRIRRRNIFFALMILAGVVITVPVFSAENNMFRGALAGLLSALTYAVLTIMNKSFSAKYSGTLTAFYEQSTAAVVLLPFMIRSGIFPGAANLPLLLVLGVVTTAAAHTLFISGLKHIPAQLAGICSAMETVYGILFAFLFLGEVPSLREILGGLIIIGTVTAAQMKDAVESRQCGEGPLL